MPLRCVASEVADALCSGWSFSLCMQKHCPHPTKCLTAYTARYNAFSPIVPCFMAVAAM